MKWMHVLLSIKPEFVEKIFSGEKKFEYRKVIFRRSGITKVIIYSTLPEGKIVGEFSIDRIIKGVPRDIWKKTKNDSGIKKDFFKQYFNGRPEGYAIKISDVKKYERPFKLNEIKIKVTAPQSFMYLSNEHIKEFKME